MHQTLKTKYMWITCSKCVWKQLLVEQTQIFKIWEVCNLIAFEYYYACECTLLLSYLFIF